MAMTSAQRKRNYRERHGKALANHEAEVKRAWVARNRERINAQARARRKDPDFRKKEYERLKRWRSSAVGKEKKQAQSRRWYEKQLAMKRVAMERLGGARCFSCGADDIRVLEINHRDGGGGQDRRRGHPHGAKLYFKIATGRMRTDHLNVLCRGCNAIDHLYRKYPELKGLWTVVWNSNLLIGA